jgi:hypothetical protein
MNLTPKELNKLGDQAFYGQDQDKNIELAFTYYKQAADMNNPVGLYNLGKYYFTKENYKKAYQYFKKSMDLEYSESYLKLYQMYIKGMGIRRSKKKAYKIIQEASEHYIIQSYHILGQMYEEGIGTRQNTKLAHKFYEQSASKNQAIGMYYFGLFLLKQKNKNQEHEQAFYWLDKAASMHYKPAILEMIELYQLPHSFVNKRSNLYLEEMVFHYKELLAKTKDIDALREVAKSYEEGKTYLSKSHQKSFDYYRILHELDDIEGYFGLGKAYLYGLGVEKDYDKAKDYLEIASSRNYHEAKTMLGDIYRHGYGVQADYHKAKEYYLGAAENDQIDALINLSLLHYRGQINHANVNQAFVYITRACEQDNAKAFFWLGLYHELGIGTEIDKEEAMNAYKRAIQLGNNAARYKLSSLMYKELKKKGLSKRKQDQAFEEIKTLLMTYIEAVDSDNRLKAIYMLGELYLEEKYSRYSPKISRYYFELASENGYAKAMNRLYDIYLDEDLETAISWLKKASETELDGEALYKLSLLYEEGQGSIPKDYAKSQKLLAKSAKLNYAKAIEKITFEGDK